MIALEPGDLKLGLTGALIRQLCPIRLEVAAAGLTQRDETGVKEIPVGLRPGSQISPLAWLMCSAYVWRHELHEWARMTGQTIVLKHLPTPLAKTVFGQEVHFRLLDGRLAYVPLNELVDILSAQWQQKVWKLKERRHVKQR